MPEESGAETVTTAAETQISTTGAAANNDDEEEKVDSENEYDSDYDEEGRYIWGAEGDDWEFYYQEDKEAYEAGQSTVPETLNPGALPTRATQNIQTSTATGTTV